MAIITQPIWVTEHLATSKEVGVAQTPIWVTAHLETSKAVGVMHTPLFIRLLNWHHKHFKLKLS